MKTAEIVEAGKLHLKDSAAEYVRLNPPPAGAKDAEGKPVTKNIAPPAWRRKTVNAFLGSYNLHEAFMEDILGL